MTAAVRAAVLAALVAAGLCSGSARRVVPPAPAAATDRPRRGSAGGAS